MATRFKLITTRNKALLGIKHNSIDIKLPVVFFKNIDNALYIKKYVNGYHNGATLEMIQKFINSLLKSEECALFLTPPAFKIIYKNDELSLNVSNTNIVVTADLVTLESFVNVMQKLYNLFDDLPFHYIMNDSPRNDRCK